MHGWNGDHVDEKKGRLDREIEREMALSIHIYFLALNNILISFDNILQSNHNHWTFSISCNEKIHIHRVLPVPLKKTCNGIHDISLYRSLSLSPPHTHIHRQSHVAVITCLHMEKIVN